MSDSRWAELRRLGPWWLCALFFVGGMVIVTTGHVRIGGYVMAIGPALGAILRLTLPSSRAGGLRVRSRGLDVAMLLATAVALAVAFFLLRNLP